MSTLALAGFRDAEARLAVELRHLLEKLQDLITGHGRKRESVWGWPCSVRKEQNKKMGYRVRVPGNSKAPFLRTVKSCPCPHAESVLGVCYGYFHLRSRAFKTWRKKQNCLSTSLIAAKHPLTETFRVRERERKRERERQRARTPTIPQAECLTPGSMRSTTTATWQSPVGGEVVVDPLHQGSVRTC